jgi:ubiquinone/menaquinone biosynthesis C-methylase UbiE
MLEVLKEKNTKELSIEPIQKDLTSCECFLHVNGIVSSMTLHHIKDLKDIFQKFYNILKDGGFIAIADLKTEDGTFHSNNDGVFHFGFKKEELFEILEEIGFKNLDFQTINTIKKPHKEFEVFLLTAFKG